MLGQGAFIALGFSGIANLSSKLNQVHVKGECPSFGNDFSHQFMRFVGSYNSAE